MIIAVLVSERGEFDYIVANYFCSVLLLAADFECRVRVSGGFNGVVGNALRSRQLENISVPVQIPLHERSFQIKTISQPLQTA